MPPTRTASDVADRTIIEAIIAAEDDAWLRGDAAAFSQAVAADCVFTNILGQVFAGREAFEDQHARIFATIYKGTRLNQTISHLRFVRADVVIVDTDAALIGLAELPRGVHSPNGSLRTRLLQIFVKDDGEWRIASFHNVDVKSPPGAD